ncbi:hypothetical protein E2C01_011768 [Portunus trituberculatus]|uniref:Uncharacterized protein n=1 Tax=Portunus trituberculatus TaxID=210409 RepID=A0A5B7DBZ4_PORTR|nr:hypothetical protein [Portunus trituberculatus]
MIAGLIRDAHTAAARHTDGPTRSFLCINICETDQSFTQRRNLRGKTFPSVCVVEARRWTLLGWT